VSRDIARNIRLKRVYDPPSPDDGYRILSMRYWPRGIPRAAVDEYTTKVAPSRELVYEFKHEGLEWEPYVERYLTEMATADARWEIARLARIAESRTITLMCGCEDESQCHRSLLRDLIAASTMQGAQA
jgi:uncharacterized protein YeaO (DUF488 family)